MLTALAIVAAQMTAPISDTVTLTTPTGALHGTLIVPASSRPVPLAVIIAGSGPTDRDGNSPMLQGKNNSLKMLAEGLAARGIASVRYDKRGIAGSAKAGGSEVDLRFTNLADDAAGWVRQYRNDPRFSSIVVVGHSEGSLLGLLATASAKADGFVSLAGAGRPASTVLKEQLSKQLPPDMLTTANRVIDTLVAGHTADFAPPVLAALFRPSVQPYLISWLPLDPAALVAKLTVPVLIVQGKHDVQVSVTDAQLLAKAQPRAKLVLVDSMNHVFKKTALELAAQQASYGDPTLPVVPQLITAVSDFILSVRKL
jgi:pimeloyl-ACP methyl ester carboxylesterase